MCRFVSNGLNLSDTTFGVFSVVILMSLLLFNERFAVSFSLYLPPLTDLGSDLGLWSYFYD